MFQRITRQVYYGNVEDGTPVMLLDNTDWYLALLKDRDQYYFMINTEGHIRYNGKVPRFAEFYFPNGYDLLLAKLITQKDNEGRRETKINEFLYKIKKLLFK